MAEVVEEEVADAGVGEVVLLCSVFDDGVVLDGCVIFVVVWDALVELAFEVVICA